MTQLRIAFCAALSAAGIIAQGSFGTFVNGRVLTTGQTQQFLQTYGLAPLRSFWYDARSGLWGLKGREPAGFLLPGHDFGPLPRDASGGSTGVFINGREINFVEASFIQRTLGNGDPWPLVAQR